MNRRPVLASPVALLSLSLLCLAAPLGLSAGCGGAGGPGSGQVVLRYAPAVGADIRYHAIVRRAPGDVPGRTVSGEGTIRGLSESDDGSHRIRIRFTTIHLAGESGSAVEAAGGVEAVLERDRLHALRGEPEVEGDPAGSDDLLRALIDDAITFPEAAIGVGDTWPVPGLERSVMGQVVRVAREGRLASVDQGVATIEIDGRVEPAQIGEGAGGARVGVTGELAERLRVRVADGLLIERDETLTLTLTASLADGTEIGQRQHRGQTHVERVAGPMPDAAAHDWHPEGSDSTCTARLRAMRGRFDHTPREVELGTLPALDMTWHQAADARDLDEAGPVVVGADQASFGRALAAAAGALDRAIVAYAAVPASVEDDELVEWLAEVPNYIEMRRLVHRPVDPPAPRRSARVTAVIESVRSSGVDVWPTALAPRIALCAPAREAFAEFGATSALRAGVLAGLERCGCGVTDLGDLEHLLDLRLGGPDLGWIPLSR